MSKVFVAAIAAFLFGVACLAPANAQPPSTYKVYFGFNLPNLTDMADEVAAVAVKNAVASGVHGITLVGHCDTAEDDPDRLSLARTEQTRNALLRHGLPEAVTITVSGKGTSEPTFPTPPNTREPLNRFVDIGLIP